MLKEYQDMHVLGEFGECIQLSVQSPLSDTHKWCKIVEILKTITQKNTY